MRKGIMGGYAKSGFIATSIAVVMLLFSSFSPLPAYADDNALQEAGDVLQILLPFTAFCSTYLYDDAEGRKQFVKSFGATIGTNSLLKLAVGKWRPNAGNTVSWPSGHTAAAFSGASFLNQRYGPVWGIPALALAAVTGYSRVNAGAHFADDVLAGMSVALLYNWYFVTPISEKVMVAPWHIKNGFGLLVNWQGLRNELKPSERKVPEDFTPRFRFEFAFGPAWESKNVIRSPSEIGSRIHLDEFDRQEPAPWTTQVSLEYFPWDRHELMFWFWPYEHRDFGFFFTPVIFAGTTFPAFAPIDSQFRFYEMRLRYRYTVIRWGRLDLKVGLSVSAQSTKTKLEGIITRGMVRDWAVLPLAHGHVGFHITEKLGVILEGDAIAFSGDWSADGRALLRYQITPRWDISAGYHYFNRGIDIAKLKNHFILNRAVVAIGYSF